MVRESSNKKTLKTRKYKLRKNGTIKAGRFIIHKDIVDIIMKATRNRTTNNAPQ